MEGAVLSGKLCAQAIVQVISITILEFMWYDQHLLFIYSGIYLKLISYKNGQWKKQKGPLCITCAFIFLAASLYKSLPTFIFDY